MLWTVSLFFLPLPLLGVAHSRLSRSIFWEIISWMLKVETFFWFKSIIFSSSLALAIHESCFPFQTPFQLNLASQWKKAAYFRLLVLWRKAKPLSNGKDYAFVLQILLQFPHSIWRPEWSEDHPVFNQYFPGYFHFFLASQAFLVMSCFLFYFLQFEKST